MNLTTFARHERLRARLATVLDLSGAAGRAAAPVVDLLVRLALAKAFFAPGMFPGIGAADLPTAWPMIIVQVIGPVLMAVGLLVRPVALLMLALTLWAQFSGAAQHLFWAALFGWYVVHGPASLSLDRLLNNGMKHSPLPLAAIAITAGDWVNRATGSLYVLAIRLWLAAALAAPVPSHAMLPVMQDGMLPSRLLIIGAVLLALGLGTPMVAAILFAAASGMAMTGRVTSVQGSGAWRARRGCAMNRRASR
jgi:NADH dehydrogenase/putative oxidoreductase